MVALEQNQDGSIKYGSIEFRQCSHADRSHGNGLVFVIIYVYYTRISKVYAGRGWIDANRR